MAQLGNKKIFSGMAGNVVFRNLNGKQIAQSRPSNVKHSATQKKSASEFGSSSNWAKQLRLGLSSFLVGMSDSYMYQRFTTAIYNTIKDSDLPQGARTPLNADMQGIEGFEFNSNSPFSDYFSPELTTTLTATNEIQLTLPAFNAAEGIAFPEQCDNVKLIVYAYATDFKDNPSQLVFHNILEINRAEAVPTQTLLSTTPIAVGHFVIVAAKLLYFKPNIITQANYLNTKEFSPAQLVFAGAMGA